MPFHEAYLGKRLQDLLALAHAQMKRVYEGHGLVIPVEGSSTLHALAPGKWMSLTDITRQLDQSHQLIAQRLGKLRDLSLIDQRDDPQDRRRSEYSLTAQGEDQWHRLDRLLATTMKVNRRLYEEIDCDLVRGLDRAIAALNDQDYHTRFGTLTTPTMHEEART